MAKKTSKKFQSAIKKRAKIYFSVLVIVSIMCLINLTVNSYALWFSTNNQPDNNLITTGCFNITYLDLDANGNSTSINLLNAYPISEQKGTKLRPYEFKLKNVCNVKADYRIVLSKLSNSNLDNAYLRYSFNEFDKAIIVTPFPMESNTVLDDSTTNIVNEMNGPNTVVDNYLLEENILYPNEEKTYNLRIWIDESAGNDQMEKMFEGVVSVSAIASDSNNV